MKCRKRKELEGMKCWKRKELELERRNENGKLEWSRN